MNLSISQFSYDNPRFQSLINRQEDTPLAILETVSRIIADVKDRGDSALYEYMLKFDGIDLSSTGPQVSDEEFEEAMKEVDEEYGKALEKACANLMKFHQHQLARVFKVEYPDGAEVERRTKPIDRIGITVPSAAAPLSSSKTHT